MSVPRVTAVVINWNGTSVIQACLESLIASTYERLTVMVVDNASDDDSVRLIEDRYPTVRIERTGKNLGYAGGANHGLRAAQAAGTVGVRNYLRSRPGWFRKFAARIFMVWDMSSHRSSWVSTTLGR